MTSKTPYATLPTQTHEEKETKKLAVEQQKLQRKIKAAEKKAANLEEEKSEEELDTTLQNTWVISKKLAAKKLARLHTLWKHSFEPKQSCKS